MTVNLSREPLFEGQTGLTPKIRDGQKITTSCVRIRWRLARSVNHLEGLDRPQEPLLSRGPPAVEIRRDGIAEAFSIQGDPLKIGPFPGSWFPSNADHDQRLVALELYHRLDASISPGRVPLSRRSRRRRGNVFPQDEGHHRAVLAEHRQIRSEASRPGSQIREGQTGGITIFYIHSRRANRPLATVMRSRCARWSLPSHRLWSGRSMAGPFFEEVLRENLDVAERSIVDPFSPDADWPGGNLALPRKMKQPCGS